MQMQTPVVDATVNLLAPCIASGRYDANDVEFMLRETHAVLLSLAIKERDAYSAWQTGPAPRRQADDDGEGWKQGKTEDD